MELTLGSFSQSRIMGYQCYKHQILDRVLFSFISNLSESYNIDNPLSLIVRKKKIFLFFWVFCFGFSLIFSLVESRIPFFPSLFLLFLVFFWLLQSLLQLFPLISSQPLIFMSKSGGPIFHHISSCTSPCAYNSCAGDKSWSIHYIRLGTSNDIKPVQKKTPGRFIFATRRCLYTLPYV